MSEPAKCWSAVCDGKTLMVQDLPLGELETIEKETGVWFLTIVDNPMCSAAVAVRVLGAVARSCGVAEPVGITSRQMIEMFALVDDDMATDAGGGEPGPLSDGLEGSTR